MSSPSLHSLIQLASEASVATVAVAVATVSVDGEDDDEKKADTTKKETVAEGESVSEPASTPTATPSSDGESGLLSSLIREASARQERTLEHIVAAAAAAAADTTCTKSLQCAAVDGDTATIIDDDADVTVSTLPPYNERRVPLNCALTMLNFELLTPTVRTAIVTAIKESVKREETQFLLGGSWFLSRQANGLAASILLYLSGMIRSMYRSALLGITCMPNCAYTRPLNAATGMIYSFRNSSYVYSDPFRGIGQRAMVFQLVPLSARQQPFLDDINEKEAMASALLKCIHKRLSMYMPIQDCDVGIYAGSANKYARSPSYFLLFNAYMYPKGQKSMASRLIGASRSPLNAALWHKGQLHTQTEAEAVYYQYAKEQVGECFAREVYPPGEQKRMLDEASKLLLEQQQKSSSSGSGSGSGADATQVAMPEQMYYDAPHAAIYHSTKALKYLPSNRHQAVVAGLMYNPQWTSTHAHLVAPDARQAVDVADDTYTVSTVADIKQQRLLSAAPAEITPEMSLEDEKTTYKCLTVHDLATWTELKTYEQTLREAIVATANEFAVTCNCSALLRCSQPFNTFEIDAKSSVVRYYDRCAPVSRLEEVSRGVSGCVVRSSTYDGYLLSQFETGTFTPPTMAVPMSITACHQTQARSCEKTKIPPDVRRNYFIEAASPTAPATVKATSVGDEKERVPFPGDVATDIDVDLADANAAELGLSELSSIHLRPFAVIRECVSTNGL